MGTTAVNGDDKVNAGLCLALSNQLGDFIAEAVSSEGLMPFLYGFTVWQPTALRRGGGCDVEHAILLFLEQALQL